MKFEGLPSQKDSFRFSKLLLRWRGLITKCPRLSGLQATEMCFPQSGGGGAERGCQMARLCRGPSSGLQTAGSSLCPLVLEKSLRGNRALPRRAPVPSMGPHSYDFITPPNAPSPSAIPLG